MPLIRRTIDGQTVWFRPPFKPADYTVPQRELADIAKSASFRGGEDIFTVRDGPFVNYRTVQRFTRDGKQWVLLWESLRNFCIEVEVLPVGFGEVIPIAPERAWEISCERDKSYGGHVVYQ